MPLIYLQAAVGLPSFCIRPHINNELSALRQAFSCFDIAYDLCSLLYVAAHCIGVCIDTASQTIVSHYCTFLLAA